MKKITNREKEVLKSLIHGFNNDEIALELNVSKHTVKAHISSIISKLGAKNRVNALFIAVKNNLI